MSMVKLIKVFLRRQIEDYIRHRLVHLSESAVERLERKYGVPKEVVRQVEEQIADEILKRLYKQEGMPNDKQRDG